MQLSADKRLGDLRSGSLMKHYAYTQFMMPVSYLLDSQVIQAPCNLVQCTVLASNIEPDITVCTIKKSQQHCSAQLCVQSKNLNCIFLEVALLNVVLLLIAKISSSLPVTNLLKEIVFCNQLGIFNSRCMQCHSIFSFK